MSSNLEELNLDSEGELAMTLDPNLILPGNMCMPIRSPTSNSEAAMLETASVEENVGVEHEGEETENESEAERTENDEENESEEEEEEEEEVEENEHNETEYEESEEEETEEEEEEEETEDDEQQDATVAQRPLAPSSGEAPTSISSSSSSATGVRTTVATSGGGGSPTIQLTRVQMQHPKIGTVSGTMDIKMLTSNQGGHIRKQIYNNNVHDVGSGATTTVMIQAAKREISHLT